MTDNLDLCPHLGWSALATCVICAIAGAAMVRISVKVRPRNRIAGDDLREGGRLFLNSAALTLAAFVVIAVVSAFVHPVVRIETAGVIGVSALLLAVCIGDQYMRCRHHWFWTYTDILRAATVVLITLTGVFGLAAFFRQLFMNLP